MKITSFDVAALETGLETLPIRLRLTTSRSAAVSRLLLLAPAMVLFATPLAIIAANAADATSAMTLIAEKPSAAIKASLGLLVWGGLFVWPLKRAVSRLGGHRSVEIDGATVRVAEKGAFGGHAWETPLSAFTGIAHHVRTSLSGTRHELILVHPEPGKSLLLTTADRISQTTIDKTTAMLGLPEVPARSLYAGPGRAA